MTILAIDPGRDKVGLVVWSKASGLLLQKIIKSAEFASYLDELSRKYKVSMVVLGDGTQPPDFQTILQEKSYPYVFVDEKKSTEEAKILYFKENPPKGWRRLVPIGLLTPSRPLDDYAARVILARFLKK